MSRTRNKTMGAKSKSTFARKMASRKVRRTGNAPIQDIDSNIDIMSSEGSVHHKLYPQWDICDWKCLYFNERKLRRDYERRYDEGCTWPRRLRFLTKKQYVDRMVHRAKSKQR